MNKEHLEMKDIIEDLITNIDGVKESWRLIRKDNPDFEQVSEKNWETKESLLWIHGETKTFEITELERWLYREPPLSQTAMSDANDNYLAWIDHIREDGTYSEFDSNNLPKPEGKEPLSDYIIRLSKTVEEKGWGTKKELRALKSFLHFLREDYHQEDIAFIEHIFPKKIELRGGRIIRKVPPQVHAIPVEVAGDIIKKLAYRCAYGRQNSRDNAGEALALLWLCIASARIRWPRTLESVHEVRAAAVIRSEEFSEFEVPSIFGPCRVRIGSYVSKFLLKIAEISSKSSKDTIFQTPLPDLRKHLRQVIREIDLPAHFGDVTFLTFLSSPHYWGRNIR